MFPLWLTYEDAVRVHDILGTGRPSLTIVVYQYLAR